MSQDFLRKVLDKLIPYEDIDHILDVAQTMERSHDGHDRGWGALAKGFINRYRGNIDVANEDFDRALAAFSSVQNKNGLMHLLRHRGFGLAERGEHAAAIEVYRRGLELALELEDKVFIAWIRILTGHEFIALGNHSEALVEYLCALDLLKEMNNREDIPSCLVSIGNVYGYSADYNNALKYFREALQLAEDLQQYTTAAHAVGNIGILHSVTHQFDEAVKYQTLALEYARRTNQPTFIVAALKSLGLAYGGLDDPAQACVYIEQAMALASEQQDAATVACMRVDYAIELINSKRFDDAEQQLQIYDSLKIEDPFMRINFYRVYADLYIERGERDKAIAILNEAMKLATAIDRERSKELIHTQLRDIYKAAGDFENYLVHNDALQEIADKTRSTDIIKQMALQQKEDDFEAERKERERERTVLHATLPPTIAERVIRGEQVTDVHESASVLFVDIVGFTQLSEALEPMQVSSLLDSIFSLCDRVCGANNITRIKTIGDSYLGVAFPTTPEGHSNG